MEQLKHQNGWFIPTDAPPQAGRALLVRALQTLHAPVFVVQDGDVLKTATDGQVTLSAEAPSAAALPVLAYVPPLPPSHLGHPSFQERYGVHANYVAGAMANGIASEAVVIEMAKAGLLGFFGAAGLPTSRIAQAIHTIRASIGPLPFGVNLIHSPQTPQQEWDSVALFLEQRVTIVSASAFMKLTKPIVWYRLSGAHTDGSGTLIVPNRVMAKVSREEVAQQFMKPPPKAMVDALLAEGKITAAEAALAPHVSMADDITAEADSGGHTDRQPAPVLMPLMLALRNRITATHDLKTRIRIGAAGGITTPEAAAGAFAMGADYVLTGTINQACVEAGTSDMVKEMLSTASAADVDMGPAGDMFEQGAEVQVLKRGTLFAMRGRHLYELYKTYDSVDAIPTAVREKLEKQIFRAPLTEIWSHCSAFFAERDPKQLTRADKDPRHKMALIFRWYLGLSSRWAITGDASRKMDTQIWCGPGIGAFNAWTKGSFLEAPGARSVSLVAANMMAGAAAITRARQLLQQGVDAGPEATVWTPRPLAPSTPTPVNS